MSKAKKTSKPTAKKPMENEQPLKVNGSFMDFIGAVVKDANSKPKKKQ
jgi:hypothetical protein